MPSDFGYYESKHAKDADKSATATATAKQWERNK